MSSTAELRNAQRIVEQLDRCILPGQRVLEIGSGSGTLAITAATRHADWIWQTSELPERLGPLLAAVHRVGLANLPRPLALDVRLSRWAVESQNQTVDCVVGVNLCHVMAPPTLTALVAGSARVLPPSGQLILVGPFSDASADPLPNHQALDRQLKAIDRQSGVRSWQAVEALVRSHGFGAAYNSVANRGDCFLSWSRDG